MLAMTYTVKYDGRCLGGDDQSLPTETLRRVTVPFLSVCSSGTMMPALHDSAAVLADALPDGAVYLHDGVIEAVQPRRRTAPVGFADARRVATGGSSIRA